MNSVEHSPGVVDPGHFRRTAAIGVGVFSMLSVALGLVLTARPREEERFLYANVPNRTFGGALRHGWLPEPGSLSLAALQMRIGHLLHVGTGLWFGRLMSATTALLVVATTLALARWSGFVPSRVHIAALAGSGVLVIGGALFDGAVQQTLAGSFLAWCAVRRLRRPTVANLVLLWGAGGVACVVSPRLGVLVAAVGAAGAVSAWSAGARFEAVALAPGIAGAATVAVAVAYRGSLAGDLRTREPWPWPVPGNVAVIAASVLLLGLMVGKPTPLHTPGARSGEAGPAVGTGMAGRSPARVAVAGWLAGGLVVALWSVIGHGPPVWWSFPAMWLAWVWVTSDPSPEGSRRKAGPTTHGPASAIATVAVLGVSLFAWTGLVNRVDDASALASVVFQRSAPGDQIVFLPAELRVSFERNRPRAQFFPEPEYPSATWGGYPGPAPVPASLAPQVGERIADTAQRIWVVTSGEGEGDGAETAAAFAALRIDGDRTPEVDERRGGLRVRCFVSDQVI